MDIKYGDAVDIVCNYTGLFASVTVRKRRSPDRRVRGEEEEEEGEEEGWTIGCVNRRIVLLIS